MLRGADGCRRAPSCERSELQRRRPVCGLARSNTVHTASARLQHSAFRCGDCVCSAAELYVSLRRHGHVHNTVCWPDCRSADQTDLGRCGLAVRQLTRPILGVPQAFRPHLAALAAKQKRCTHKDQSTTSSRASGWHAKTRNLRFRLAGAPTLGLRPQKKTCLFRGAREIPSGRPAASSLALMQL